MFENLLLVPGTHKDSPTPKQRPQVVIMRVMSSSFFCMIERFEVLSAAYEKKETKNKRSGKEKTRHARANAQRRARIIQGGNAPRDDA